MKQALGGEWELFPLRVPPPGATLAQHRSSAVGGTRQGDRVTERATGSGELLLEPSRFPVSSAVSGWLGNPGSCATRWESPAGPLGAEEGAAGVSPG